MKLENMVEEVLMKLRGFSNYQYEPQATLAAPMTATAMTLTINGSSLPEGSDFLPGIWELGTELVYVQSFNKQTGVATGVLRAQGGTTAVAHPAGRGVISNPKFPRSQITQAINDAIVGIYPRLVVVGSVELTPKSNQYDYEMPANANAVISVEYRENPRDAWHKVNRWRFDKYGAASSTTKRTLTLNDSFGFTSKIQAVYTGEAKPISFGQTFDSSGLPDYAREIVIFAACIKMMTFMDTQKASNPSVAQQYGNAFSPVGSSTATMRLLLAQQEEMIARAEARQRTELPIVKHWI